MQTSTNPQITVPAPTVSNLPTPKAPQFAGDDPFWIIVAIAIIVWEILGHKDSEPRT